MLYASILIGCVAGANANLPAQAPEAVTANISFAPNGQVVNWESSDLPLVAELPEPEIVRWDLDLEYLLDMLCYIFRCWEVQQGGHAMTTQFVSPEAVQNFIDSYELLGLSELDPTKVDQALIDLDILRDHVSGNPGVLNGTMQQELLATIKDMREELLGM